MPGLGPARRDRDLSPGAFEDRRGPVGWRLVFLLPHGADVRRDGHVLELLEIAASAQEAVFDPCGGVLEQARPVVGGI